MKVFLPEKGRQYREQMGYANEIGSEDIREKKYPASEQYNS